MIKRILTTTLVMSLMTLTGFASGMDSTQQLEESQVKILTSRLEK